jgi:Asp-tRNA(Asn)/Glu-tRNA(Gln) amidotransferase A subunit family amidase
MIVTSMQLTISSRRDIAVLQKESSSLEGEEDVKRQCQHADQFLPIFNITGQPALSIPIGVSSLGLPIGLQLVGRSAHEHVVLALGQQLMEAAPVRARPAVWAGAH